MGLRDGKRLSVAKVHWEQRKSGRCQLRKALYSMVKCLDTILRIMGSHWKILIRRKTCSDFYDLILWGICFLYVKSGQ